MKPVYPYHIFKEDEHTLCLEARFWACNYVQIAIVAIVTKEIDWAAYIGGDTSYTEAGTEEYVAAYGVKLSEQDAKHFFPAIELPYRQ